MLYPCFHWRQASKLTERTEHATIAWGDCAMYDYIIIIIIIIIIIKLAARSLAQTLMDHAVTLDHER